MGNTPTHVYVYNTQRGRVYKNKVIIIIHGNKSYANPKFRDFPAISRFFNNVSPQYGPSVSKPPQITVYIDNV